MSAEIKGSESAGIRLVHRQYYFSTDNDQTVSDYAFADIANKSLYIQGSLTSILFRKMRGTRSDPI
jgi:hypothetical protein